MAKRKETVEKKEVIEFPMDKKFICLIINEDSQGKPVELKAMANGVDFFEEIGILEYRLNSLKVENTIKEAFSDYLNKVTEDFNQMLALGNATGSTPN